MNIYWIEDPLLTVTLPIAETENFAWGKTTGKTSSLNLLILGAILAGMPQAAQAKPLDFDLPDYQSQNAAIASVATAAPDTPTPISPSKSTHRKRSLAVPTRDAPRDRQPDKLKPLFAGGSDSLVARAVGTAEGTRTPTGGYTQAYAGHRDPGNGVWNLGTFSYQHGASSPAEADDRQLQRLRTQAGTLTQQAQAKNLTLSLPDLLNGIDLANQAPEAALDHGGYLDRLYEARERGLAGETAIVWARTYAFIDPETGHWDAPGLGNDRDFIWHDQKRRARAIAAALEAWEDQPQPNSESLADQPRPAQRTVHQSVAIAAGPPPEPHPETSRISPPDSKAEAEPVLEPSATKSAEAIQGAAVSFDRPPQDMTDAIISLDLEEPPEVAIAERPKP